MEIDRDSKEDWLIDQSEKFCQEKALLNALQKSISIFKGTDKSQAKGAIPDILQQALGVCFDASIGHDFMEDADLRYELYHRVEQKIPFDLEYLNKITKGGLSRKTLTVLIASTGVGKTAAMCHMAAANLAMGKNVLYITLEMGEAGDPSISERIEANLLDVAIDDLLNLPKKNYDEKFAKLKGRIDPKAKLIIKEYPTATAGSGTFRALIDELRIKKNFVPDIIYVDYLNICISTRFKGEKGVNSYTYIKSIAEELRGIAVQYDVPVVSATQTNRAGYNNSDIDLTETSESIGLPMTVDLMFALYQSEELARLGQIMVKQLKNRYTDKNNDAKFVIGIDKPKMRLYNVEASAQTLIDQKVAEEEDIPLMDQTHFGIEENERAKPVGKFNRNKFRDFK